jgi:hypothetical protein
MAHPPRKRCRILSLKSHPPLRLHSSKRCQPSRESRPLQRFLPESSSFYAYNTSPLQQRPVAPHSLLVSVRWLTTKTRSACADPPHSFSLNLLVSHIPPSPHRIINRFNPVRWPSGLRRQLKVIPSFVVHQQYAGPKGRGFKSHSHQYYLLPFLNWRESSDYFFGRRSMFLQEVTM